MKFGINKPIKQQCDDLKTILCMNSKLYYVINEIQGLEITNCYIGGGSIAQTVWNYQYGYTIDYGIEDIDIVYFDNNDLSEEAENIVLSNVKKHFSNINYKFDVKNEARVHLWYRHKFGVEITPYTSTEHAISTWPSTSTSIGVRGDAGILSIFAPYGLSDMYMGIIRPNKSLISKEIYEQKSKKWHQKWPETIIVDW